MDEKKIKKLLEILAKKGVCRTGKRYLNTTKKDFQTLVKVWKGWPEYFCEHSETIIKTLRESLDTEMKKALAESNIYIDYEGDITLKSDTAIFFVGNTKANVVTEPFAMVKLYLFNEAQIDIKCTKNAYANIEAYDTTMVKLTNESDIEQVVFVYDEAKVEHEGIANIHMKEYNRGEVFNGKEVI